MDMRKVVIVAGAALITLAAGAVTAQSTQPAPKAKAKNERRQCFTRAEWDRIAEAARARGQRLQSDMTSAGAISN